MTTTGTPPSSDASARDDASASARILGLPRRWFFAAAIALVALLAVAIVWFEPQALFLDERVDEAFPAAVSDGAVEDDSAIVEDSGAAADEAAEDAVGGDTTGDDTAGDDTAGADRAADQAAGDDTAGDTAGDDGATGNTGPVQLSSGEFAGRNDYSAVGTASVFDVDGERVLRFEEFETDNGPDLVVWLTSADADADDATIRGDFIELEELKGNIGDQNYALSADINLDAYDTVVIWCRRFTVGFATAALA